MTDYSLLSPTSKVWIYQCDKKLDTDIVEQLKMQIEKFTTQWTAHNHALKAWGDFYYGRFLVLMVDESQAAASGCSIDKSVAFVKAIQEAVNADFFNRLIFAFKIGEKIFSVDRDTFESLYKKAEINDDTIVFNNLVQTKAEFEDKWQIPLGESWHRNFV